MMRIRYWALAVAALTLTACGAGQSRPSRPPSVRATPTVQAARARCARLAALGFNPCPPPPSQIKLPRANIRNATNGAISNTIAQEWGMAFLRGQVYYYWAIQHDDEQTLRSGVFALSDPNTVGELFGHDLQDLDKVRQAGGTMVYQPTSNPVVQVVVIPSSLQSAMVQQGLHPAKYGLAVEFKGPASRAIRLPHGGLKVLWSYSSSYLAELLVWGTYRRDPDLGPIWYEYGYYSCVGEVEPVCGL